MKKLTRLQLITHISGWIPLIVLVVQYFTHNLTVDPIQASERSSGQTAILFLVLSLACTPFFILTGFSGVNKLRRPLGLFAFLYTAVHFIIFSFFDYGLNWAMILSITLSESYLFVGTLALLILLPLALTSWSWWIRKMGKNWARLHSLVYIAGILVVLHYAWVKKGDLFLLRGEILRPLIYAFIVLLLLGIRLPPVRRKIIQLRAKSRPMKALNDVVLNQLNKPVWSGVHRERAPHPGS